ncbi:MAG: twin-arginine translocase subunit TatB [Rhodobacter sp.]|nr:twin-arginine translocase subunit TatB [Paracoccaceae bacterium]MCB1408627.1 twin-arginine translocase subunit TatB [Paracoccaceae bacterium]MCC0080047.1 twin-arginine translocase subunit TatB [Rhodobacter sp.]
MFDIGWSEMMVVGVVALIVVGPKDLPKMFHTLGEFTGKARGMAREFQRAMDAAARESGVNDVVKDLRRTTSGQALKEAAGFDEIEKQFKDLRQGPGKGGAQTKASAKPPVAGPAPAAADDPEDGDEAAVQAHDDDLAARNAAMSATEAERLKKQQKAEAARLKAAAIRARKEAEAAEAAATEAAREAGDDPQAWAPAPKPAPKQPEAES